MDETKEFIKDSHDFWFFTICLNEIGRTKTSSELTANLIYPAKGSYRLFITFLTTVSFNFKKYNQIATEMIE